MAHLHQMLLEVAFVVVAVWTAHLVVRTLVLSVTTAGRDAWRNLQPAVTA